METKLGIT